ncbi:MAG: glycosyltransferase family 4 protein [Gemmatimonadaceae bacterium]
MTADTVGGVWNYAIELAAALSPYDVEVTIATMGAPLTDAQWREARARDNVDVVESTYRLEWMPDPWADVQFAGEWRLDIASDRKPDIIHLNGYAHATLDWNAPTCVVAHSCVLSWWRSVNGEAAPPEWSQYREVVSVGLHRADVVVAPSHAMLAALDLEYGHIPGARVVYNGRNAARFPRAQKEPLVLSVGRLWDEAKNVGVLEAVAPMLGWPVYIAGTTEPPGGGLAYVTRGQSARYLGMLDSTELATWMARASIYALPARYEPFGLSVLEAALAGCALVLGDIRSLRELWDGAALFAPPTDVSALRDALRSLIADDALRATVATACHRRALDFTTQRMADGYMTVYRDLLDTAQYGQRHASRRTVCVS